MAYAGRKGAHVLVSCKQPGSLAKLLITNMTCDRLRGRRGGRHMGVSCYLIGKRHGCYCCDKRECACSALTMCYAAECMHQKPSRAERDMLGGEWRQHMCMTRAPLARVCLALQAVFCAKLLGLAGVHRQPGGV